MTDEPSVALMHDWLITQGGAEQALRAMSELWPSAPIHTLLYDPRGPCAA